MWLLFSLIVSSLVIVNALNSMCWEEERCPGSIAAGINKINLLIWANVLLIRAVKSMFPPLPSSRMWIPLCLSIKYQAVCLHFCQNGYKDHIIIWQQIHLDVFKWETNWLCGDKKEESKRHDESKVRNTGIVNYTAALVHSFLHQVTLSWSRMRKSSLGTLPMAINLNFHRTVLTHKDCIRIKWGDLWDIPKAPGTSWIFVSLVLLSVFTCRTKKAFPPGEMVLWSKIFHQSELFSHFKRTPVQIDLNN